MTARIVKKDLPTPEKKKVLETADPNVKKALDEALARIKAQQDAANAKAEAEAKDAEAKAEALKNMASSASKSFTDISHFLRALEAAFGSDLQLPKLSEKATDEFITKLAEKYSVVTNLDTHVAGTPVQFVGQGDSPATYNVTKDEISVDHGDFGPEQAREMVALAALDKSMLKDGIDLSGNNYERSLIQMAVLEHNKSNPRTKLTISDGGLRKSFGRGYDQEAKRAWKQGEQKPASGPDETKPEESKDLGSLSQETYSELAEHIQKEGKATDKILNDFLKAKDLGETSLKDAVADAKAALRQESFIEVVPHGKGERLKVNLIGDFGASASGATSSDSAKPKPKPENPKPVRKRSGPGES